jgi:hypothetical protein
MESKPSVKRWNVKYSAYASRARILTIQESLDGHAGHLEGIPFVLRQVPKLQCELRNDILDESVFLCEK